MRIPTFKLVLTLVGYLVTTFLCFFVQVTHCFVVNIINRVFMIAFSTSVAETPVKLIYSIGFLIETIDFITAYSDFTAIQRVLHVWECIKSCDRTLTVHFFFIVFVQ